MQLDRSRIAPFAVAPARRGSRSPALTRRRCVICGRGGDSRWAGRCGGAPWRVEGRRAGEAGGGASGGVGGAARVRALGGWLAARWPAVGRVRA